MKNGNKIEYPALAVIVLPAPGVCPASLALYANTCSIICSRTFVRTLF